MTESQTARPAPQKATAEEAKQPNRANPKPFAIIALILFVAIGAYFVWSHFFSAPDIPRSIVALSGRIEGDDSALAAKTSGRIAEMRVREGDQVKAGDVIAIIDDEQIRAREQQAQSAVDQAQAQLRSTRQQIAILNEQLNETQLQVSQSRQESQGQVRQAEAELAAAEAALAQQEASYKLAEFDRDAYTKLAKSGAVSERQGKQAETNAETQAALVNSARRRVESARAAVSQAKATLVNPQIRTTQAAMIRQQIAQQQAQISGAEAQAAQARAKLLEAQANRSDLQVRAPFDGTVVTRTAEPGEVVNAGSPLITLLDLTKVYLRGFVPEGQIGRVRVGQAARVYLDSAPTTPVEAYVSRIDPQASFTPENTYFREDRVKQVVGVKIQLKGAIGFAKPGMPSDGEILVEGDRFPENTRKR
jgi:HlyD family secretion protein